VIDGELVLGVEGGEIGYEVVNRPSSTKGYETAEIDHPAYLNGRTLLLGIPGEFGNSAYVFTL